MASSSGAVLWSGEGFDDLAGATGNDGASVLMALGAPAAVDVTAAQNLSPLDYYRLTMEAKKINRRRFHDKSNKGAANGGKKGKQPLPTTWADYLETDQRCPWCLEMFSGTGEPDSPSPSLSSSLLNSRLFPP